ncbi:MAG TPA: response regulator [Gemmataceae bacterium]|nr:response regulator [Gemmataceae bacterium]
MNDRPNPAAKYVPLVTRSVEYGVRAMTSRCETIASCPEQARLGPRRVLIVEDNPLSRNSLRYLLESRGHHVEVAATGAEGVRVGVSRRHDVAVIDLSLPDWDGFRVARALRAVAGARITLIAYTGHDDFANRVEAKAAGFDDYLVKPTDLLDLLHWFDSDFCSGE